MPTGIFVREDTSLLKSGPVVVVDAVNKDGNLTATVVQAEKNGMKPALAIYPGLEACSRVVQEAIRNIFRPLCNSLCKAARETFAERLHPHENL